MALRARKKVWRGSQFPKKTASGAVFALARQYTCLVLTGRFPCCILRVGQYQNVAVSTMQVQGFGRAVTLKRQLDNMPVDSIAPLLREVWKRVDDVAVFVKQHLIREFIPNELAVSQRDLATFVGDAAGIIGTVYGLASGQQANEKCTAYKSNIHDTE